ncbi:MAG: molybdopterin molybdotransferase MoeA [Actinomycetota bacterium]
MEYADLLSVEEARDRVLDTVGPLDAEEVLVGEALGLVSANEIRASHPLPRFANSAMDGYAVVAKDVADASEETPVELRVVGEVRAGDPGEIQVDPGSAARIMTGAPLPEGADAIVMVEVTEERNGAVLIKGSAKQGQHVRPAGDDLAAGAVLVPEGIELGPGELALLASMGMSPVEVRRGPRVALLVTGDELVDPEEEPGPGQIRDSNAIALIALLQMAGADVVLSERVPDAREAVVAAFERAAAESDVIVSSGGVAVGKYDFVKDVVEELGGIQLWRVAMQPGKPVVLGSVREAVFLGLPGNPVSVHVGFEQFVRPAIRKMRGCRSLLRPTMEAKLTETITKRPGRLHFVRVRLRSEGGEWFATPTGPQGSHIQSSLIDCHGVARFGREESELTKGDSVTVEVWRLPS